MKRLLRSTLATVLSLTALTAPLSAQAYTGGQFRFSGVLGQVGLLGDPGNDSANAIGFGLGAAYQLDEKLALDIRFLTSSHDQLDHRDLSVGAEYYFGDYASAYPHVQVGMSFLSNEFKRADTSGDAVGIYAGGGLAFDLARNFQIGPEVRFVKAFASERTVAGSRVTIVDDSYSLLLRLQYILGDD